MGDEKKLMDGMKTVCTRFNFQGSNVFKGEPLTTQAGPWYVKDPQFQKFTDASKDKEAARFATGVGMIGRAKKDGFDSCNNVQALSAMEYKRHQTAVNAGVKCCCAIFLKQWDSVVEFYGTDDCKFDKDGIEACFK
eukprot:477846_1